MPESKSSNGNIDTFRIKVIVAGLDLTQYVVSGSVSRALTTPAGTWTLYLRPIIRKNVMVDLPIRVNDYVEIRIDRSKTNSASKRGGEPILIMRGLVSLVSMSESPSQGPDGAPSRMFSISGHDMVKILQNRRLVVPPSVVTADKNIFTNMSDNGANVFFSLFPTLTMLNQMTIKGQPWIPINKWVEAFVINAMKDSLEDKSGGSTLRTFKFDVKFNIPTSDGKVVSDDGKNSLMGVFQVPLLQNWTGTYWTFIEYFIQRPFFEIFAEDTEDKTNIIVRWTPYRNGNNEFPSFERNSGKFQWAQEAPEEIVVDRSQIIQRELRRSDQDRYTYFWTQYATGAFGDTGGQMALPDVAGAAQINPYYDMAGIEQFGYKPMVTKITFLPNSMQGYIETVEPNKRNSDSNEGKQARLDIIEHLTVLNKWIIDVFAFTDSLYSGVFIIRGNPNIKIGQELIIPRPSTGSDDSDKFGVQEERYYVQSVEHSFKIFPSPQFLTKVQVSRGTGITEMYPKFMPQDQYSNPVRRTYLGVNASLKNHR